MRIYTPEECESAGEFSRRVRANTSSLQRARGEGAALLALEALRWRDEYEISPKDAREMDRWVEQMYRAPLPSVRAMWPTGTNPIGLGVDLVPRQLDVYGASNVQFWLRSDMGVSQSAGVLSTLTDAANGNVFGTLGAGASWTAADATLNNLASWRNNANGALQNASITTTIDNTHTAFWYAICKQNTWVANSRIIDANGTVQFLQAGASPDVQFYYGSEGLGVLPVTLGTWSRLCASYTDSAQDFFKVAGNYIYMQVGGAVAPTGIAIGGAYSGSTYADVSFGEIIGTHNTPSPAQLALSDAVSRGRYPAIDFTTYSFAPYNIPDNQMWLRADLGVTLSGSNVTNWADQSGRQSDYSSFPSAAAVTPNVINGKPSVQFASASAQYARCSTGTPQILVGGSATPWTMIMVIRLLTSATSTIWTAASDTASNPVHNFYAASSQFKSDRRNDSGAIVTVTESGSHATASTNFLLRFIYSGTALSIYANGTLIMNAASQSPSPLTLSNMTLGASKLNTSLFNFTNIHVLEQIAYRRLLTSGEDMQLANYLSALYALTY